MHVNVLNIHHRRHICGFFIITSLYSGSAVFNGVCRSWLELHSNRSTRKLLGFGPASLASPLKPTQNIADPRRPRWASGQSRAEMMINCIKRCRRTQPRVISRCLQARQGKLLSKHRWLQVRDDTHRPTTLPEARARTLKADIKFQLPQSDGKLLPGSFSQGCFLNF